ncbi:hypothetical protein SAMN04489713_105392 [Actinomadura madurae]|uniref:Uncharacterized protein n=1 Tax=Actinomadura madurae TaxID=1993 RepID=A0A1I5GTJ4_9ACTN|nr:hypothetical protein [Actinomadura madurae]SFO39156.1 hypothetical protein SAMN04489713_105392 [Actinomadura madurae]
METGRRAFLAGTLGAALAGTMPGWAAPAWAAQGLEAGTLRLDFGGATPEPAPGYVRVGTEAYTEARGYGWVSADGLSIRDRGGDAPQRDFVFGKAAHVFRIGSLAPGRYRLRVLSGDLTFADHFTRLRVPGVDGGEPLPVLHPSYAQFAELTATLVVPEGGTGVDVTVDSPADNWVVNALVIEPAAAPEPVRVTFTDAPVTSTWGPILTTPDPTAPLLDGHRSRSAGGRVRPTGLGRGDYLRLIASEVDFWKAGQDADGAIIDPYRNREFQYSTPAFAHAAAALVVYAGRKDLLKQAALALDWSARELAERTAADGHEDFFAPMLAHAIRLLEPHVPTARSAAWKNDIGRFDPFATYRSGIGANNWNIVAASGEALFQRMGLRAASDRYPEVSFAAQGRHFDTSYGLYLEGPMPYDHFPRLWLGDLIARGYTGPYRAELTEALRRAAITSLFMQSPNGELPAGGRSAHHQWNEAEQCVTYEVFAARALAAGDRELAAYFKRGAHLALRSMFRWVRPSGEMQIVKNWMDPAQSFGYESYSGHSQYNLLPMSMLAIAYEHAATTERVSERPAPADTGGYVLHIEPLHKVFANAGGGYVEIDTAGDHHYDATGFIRAHFAGHSPQLGSSDSLLAAPSYRIPDGPRPPTTGMGVAWEVGPGQWRHFGELEPDLTRDAVVRPTRLRGDDVRFTVRYEGDFGGGVTMVEERFAVTPRETRVTTILRGYDGPVRRVAPVLSHDGRTPGTIQVQGDAVRVWQQGEHGTSKLTYRMPGAASVVVGSEEYGNHNGLMRLAVGEYAAGAAAAGVTLVIAPQGDGRI